MASLTGSLGGNEESAPKIAGDSNHLYIYKKSMPVLPIKGTWFDPNLVTGDEQAGILVVAGWVGDASADSDSDATTNTTILLDQQLQVAGVDGGNANLEVDTKGKGTEFLTALAWYSGSNDDYYAPNFQTGRLNADLILNYDYVNSGTSLDDLGSVAQGTQPAAAGLTGEVHGKGFEVLLYLDSVSGSHTFYPMDAYRVRVDGSPVDGRYPADGATFYTAIGFAASKWNIIGLITTTLQGNDSVDWTINANADVLDLNGEVRFQTHYSNIVDITLPGSSSISFGNTAQSIIWSLGGSGAGITVTGNGTTGTTTIASTNTSTVAQTNTGDTQLVWVTGVDWFGRAWLPPTPPAAEEPEDDGTGSDEESTPGEVNSWWFNAILVGVGGSSGDLMDQRINLTYGIGDNLTFGIGWLVRSSIFENQANYDGLAYNTGGWIGFAADFLMGAGLIKQGVKQLGKTAEKEAAEKVSIGLAKAPVKGGKSVLVHYPAYKNLAEELGAKRFYIPTAVWEKVSEPQRWAANAKFLDRMIARGDDIILATRADLAKPGSYFAKELEYLISKGFKISQDGLRLIPPGGL